MKENMLMYSSNMEPLTLNIRLTIVADPSCLSSLVDRENDVVANPRHGSISPLSHNNGTARYFPTVSVYENHFSWKPESTSLRVSTAAPRAGLGQSRVIF